MVTLAVSATVFEILTLKARKSPPLQAPARGEPLRIWWWNLASENWSLGATRWWRNHDNSNSWAFLLPARRYASTGNSDRNVSIRPSVTRRYCDTIKKPMLLLTNRATRKPAKNCSNSTCLQRCGWQYWPIFVRLAVVAYEICEIPRNSQKIHTYGVKGHPRSSILVSIESPCTTS